MWHEDTPEISPGVRSSQEPIDIDTLEDGRCKASSWRKGKLPEKPTYESHFGPSGYNRCIGRVDHLNELHKDEWGNVFLKKEDGGTRVVRTEKAE